MQLIKPYSEKLMFTGEREHMTYGKLYEALYIYRDGNINIVQVLQDNKVAALLPVTMFRTFL